MKRCTASELIDIKTWDYSEVDSLIVYLKDVWQYAGIGLKESFINKSNKWILQLELHTNDWIGNKEIILALHANSDFWNSWWAKSERGGHYYFEIDYTQIGWLKVSDFCKKYDTYRAYVYKFHEKYEWKKISHGIRLMRFCKSTKDGNNV